MKDYYYFLGVPKDATDEDIRKAYRKLSLKYHPDKNPGDAYFESRFREVQEAYDQLIDPDKRSFYDANWGMVPVSVRTNNPPVIRSFSASKIRVKKGDEIILNWETQNADLVKILPFGLEKTSGERSFKITEFKNGQFHAVLQATNTLINKSVVKGITFTEVMETENSGMRHEAEDFYRKEKSAAADNPKRLGIIIMLIIFFLALALSLFFKA